MSDTISDPEVLKTLRPERAPEPAKRWANKWRLPSWSDGWADGLGLRERFGIRRYPSREIAEAYALSNAHVGVYTYLGAFPVEEGA